MKVVILAGGYGTRLMEYTGRIPKPMVEIGEHPILWHIMNIYASHGFNEFVVALGYKSEVIKEYFLKFYEKNSDFTINLENGEINILANSNPSWKVTLVNTGLDTMTGGRLKRLSKYLDKTFMLTYGDGVANVDLKKLKEFHLSHGRAATITTVHPTSKYGRIEFSSDGRITKFEEKPEFGGDWINAGFMVLEPKFLDWIDGDSCILERDPISTALDMGELFAYQHGDFWKCMDTVRDHQELELLWQKDDPPWKTWD